MVNRELIEVFSEIAREKNVERSELATILEELFLYVIEKEYGDSSNCSCIVNLDKGEIEIYAEKIIVEEIDDYKVEITMEDAIEKEPDLIILDWMLPDILGPAVLSELKKAASTKHIPVLMLTGKDKVGDIEDAFKLGAEGYLTKPFQLQKLGEKVTNMLTLQ